MSTLMKSLLTEFNDDNSEFWRWNENYVNQDHLLVNYTAGTGGEWFCGFLATHDDLAHLNTAMEAKKASKQNRWRIKSDLVGKVSNTYRRDYYNTDDFDGSDNFYRKAIQNSIEASKKHKLRQLLKESQTMQTIGRSHEAWCEVHMWPQQFKSFKVITCVNTKDKDTWPQFVSNIIKKIWLHEYDLQKDYLEEFERKFEQKDKQFRKRMLEKGRKWSEGSGLDKDKCLALVEYLGTPWTWYKLVIAITHAQHGYNVDLTNKAMLQKWQSEIADEQINKYTIPLPTPELKIDLLAMLRDRDYTGTYYDVCEFLKIQPHPQEIFETLIDHYFMEDKRKILEEKTVTDLIGATVEYAGSYT